MRLREVFFLTRMDFKVEEESEESKEESKESEEEKEEKQHDFKKFIEHIENESKGISYDLFTEYFRHTVPSVLAKELYKTRNRKKNSNLVNNIKNALRELIEEIKNMSEDQKRIENRYKILDIVEEILDFNEKHQQGQGLKILTPNQMLSRLPISLAQLKVGNNSVKLKNEIRQLLHSLYRSKKLKNQIYKSLIDII